MRNNKVVTIAIGAVAALFVLSLVMRFFLLSQYGLSGGWIFFGLPFGGVGLFVLLLRLGIINAGNRSGGMGSPWPHDFGGQTPPAPPAPYAPYGQPAPYAPQAPYGQQAPFAPQAPAPTVSQNLQELDRIHASGAISDAEYTARRSQILSAM